MKANFSLAARFARSRRTGFSILPLAWLVTFVAIGLWLILGHSDPHAVAAIADSAVMNAGGRRAHPAPSAGLGYEPIEAIRVGQRVMTPGTGIGKLMPTSVDPGTWRLLRLRMERRLADGSPDDVQVETLQPLSWIAHHGARVGARVSLPIDLTDLAEPDNPAQVIAVEPCPPVSPGPGRVVLTTVSHLNGFLFDLVMRDQRGLEEELRVTGWHKLYSQTRGDWVSTCTLTPGEVLRGHDGPLTVATLTRHPGVARVYNMTVEAEHVYYVSSLDLLAHNAGCSGSYTNTHQTGKQYVGKGPQTRMNRSATEKAVANNDPVVNKNWTPAANDEDAFIQEELRMRAAGGPGGNTYNQINSPGQKLAKKHGI